MSLKRVQKGLHMRAKRLKQYSKKVSTIYVH